MAYSNFKCTLGELDPLLVTLKLQASMVWTDADWYGKVILILGRAGKKPNLAIQLEGNYNRTVEMYEATFNNECKPHCNEGDRVCAYTFGV